MTRGAPSLTHQALLDTTGVCFGLDYSGPNYIQWLIGFTMVLFFSALSPLAFNLQKASINENDLRSAFPSSRRQATLSEVLSVRPSVRLKRQC